MSVQTFMTTHLTIVEIFQFGTKRWTSRHTDEYCYPESRAATKHWQREDRLLSPDMLDERQF